MNGLPITLTVVAVGGIIAAAGALWMGWIMERRVPPAPRLTLDDLLLPPPDVTVWTGEGWTDQDGSRFRHPSTQGLLRREAGE